MWLLTTATADLFAQHAPDTHVFNGTYTGASLDKIAFPVGGMGAGMFCLEGTGTISAMSVRNHPDVYNEPVIFGALCVKGKPNKAAVLEGSIPDWKKFGFRQGGKGDPDMDWGLRRFQAATFRARFPFATIALEDKEMPVRVTITGWSPFIPTDADNSSLPVGALEYTFTNTTGEPQEYVFSYNARNFMAFRGDTTGSSSIQPTSNGFILSQAATASAPDRQGDFAIFTQDADDSTVVDYSWFRGNWYDPLSMAWNHIQRGDVQSVPPIEKNATGASLYVPFKLQPDQTKKICILMAWYVPNTMQRLGTEPQTPADIAIPFNPADTMRYYQPWYAGRFSSIREVIAYWHAHYDQLRTNSSLFRDAFYQSTLPPEVIEAVAANLCILKSTTTLRQPDGRFWGWEGSDDDIGSCPGSCTHVWNYAQALPHLFPSLERSIRETEFNEDQDSAGHQTFRAALPIRPVAHNFYAAADGQLGAIIRVYREWRISGDSDWLVKIEPKVRLSLDYCIRTWDPRYVGALQEPHHNTYDIEFWGADPMCTGIYLGALEAFIQMGLYLHHDVSPYQKLLTKGKGLMENQLFNGKYFVQKIQWQGLNAPDPVTVSKTTYGGAYSPDAIALLEKEGPKYQYGQGCLSDGMLGVWLAQACGLPSPLDTSKVTRHLSAVYAYNYRKDLSDHNNPQRPGYALGHEGGLLLCSWPKGGQLSLPFVYSNEVWTGIEYEVASHLIWMGKVREGLDIVCSCRKRYDGRVRNPFDEYEWGHWYTRAMSSYALIEAMTGVRYDAVEKTLYVHSRIGNFTSFLSTATGFGTVNYTYGMANVKCVYGSIDVKKTIITK
jgi:uncharacterized protein (DUF608 family)